MSVLLGRGDGPFSTAPAVTVGRGPQSIVAGNYNSDTYPDLAVANGSGNGVSILLGRGAGTFETTLLVGVGNESNALTVVDFGSSISTIS